MTIALGGEEEGGYSLGGESKGIIWIHLHLFTWTPWANRNDFHLKTERRGEKAQRPTGFEVWGRVMKARFTPCEGMQITFCEPSKGCLVNYLRLQIELLSNLMFGMEGRRFLAQSLYLFCIVRCKFFFSCWMTCHWLHVSFSCFIGGQCDLNWYRIDNLCTNLWSIVI